MTLTGMLQRDGGNRYFVGPWDPTTGTGKAQRGANFDGDYADARVVLYDHLGQPLLAPAAALADGMATPTTSRIGAHPLLFNGTTYDRQRSKGTGWAGVAQVRSSDGQEVSVDAPNADAVARGSQYGPVVISTPYGYNGSTWDRLRGAMSQGGPPTGYLAVANHLFGTGSQAQVQKTAGLLAAGNNGEGLPGQALYARHPSDNNWYAVSGINFNADAVGATTLGPTVGGFGHAFNGSSWDRWRNNTEGTLLALAGRTATANSGAQANYNGRGLYLCLYVTVASGTGGLRPFVYGMFGSRLIQINPTPPMVTTTGQFGYEIYPGSSAAATGSATFQTIQRTAAVLPRTWIVYLDHSDASSYTYELMYSLIV